MNIHEDEDQILKKKQKKIDKHFSILIDARKHKILSYKISDMDFGQSIVLKSKIKLCNLEHKVSNISINHNNEQLEIVGNWHFGFSSPGIWSTTYIIQKIEYLNSSVT